MRDRAGRRRRLARALAGSALLLGAAGAAPAGAQQPPAPAVVPGPAVGDPAPDFALVGVTRYGTLRDSLRLSDLRGRTVVLAFFYKARTKG